jgi:hypothetical protein
MWARYHNGKLVVIFIMGIITTLYSLAEVVIALRYASLVMLTDALHNFSDGGALAVGFWAENKKLQVRKRFQGNRTWKSSLLVFLGHGRDPWQRSFRRRWAVFASEAPLPPCAASCSLKPVNLLTSLL